VSLTRRPSAEEQIHFLRSLQRLLDEGSFVATYKYALLHAIADLCVVQGDDTGASLRLSTSDIADQFVRLYWPQVAPFIAGDDEGVLRQNTGRAAAVVREIAERHDRYQGSFSRLQSSPADWHKLQTAVQRTVERMPLWKLQTVGAERLEFLYENLDAGSSIQLEPGVAYCFRTFYPMITDMIEGAWSHFVQRRNHHLLGHVTDLRSFLFGRDRSSLASHRSLLRELQGGRCFYCDRVLNDRGDVDHFIPWSRYPLDLGHNFVLAHRGCNSKKSDLLAAEEHLERWAERNRTLDPELATKFDVVGIRHDLRVTVRVAHWAYGRVREAGGQVWVEGRLLEALSDRWSEALVGG